MRKLILFFVFCSLPQLFFYDVAFTVADFRYISSIDSYVVRYNGLLHKVLGDENFEIVDLCLKSYLNINFAGYNAYSRSYETPLFIAIEKYHKYLISNNRQKLDRWFEIIKTLLRMDAEIVTFGKSSYNRNGMLSSCGSLECDLLFYSQKFDLKEVLNLFQRKLSFIAKHYSCIYSIVRCNKHILCFVQINCPDACNVI